MSNMEIGMVIAGEILAAGLWAYVFWRYDQRIRRWERRTARRAKRWICRRLAADGIWAANEEYRMAREEQDERAAGE